MFEMLGSRIIGMSVFKALSGCYYSFCSQGWTARRWLQSVTFSLLNKLQTKHMRRCRKREKFKFSRQIWKSNWIWYLIMFPFCLSSTLPFAFFGHFCYVAFTFTVIGQRKYCAWDKNWDLFVNYHWTFYFYELSRFAFSISFHTFDVRLDSLYKYVIAIGKLFNVLLPYKTVQLEFIAGLYNAKKSG